METQINRYEYILAYSIQKNISFLEARKEINRENDTYNFSKQNGDQINANNIYNKDKKSFVYSFYKNIYIYTDKNRKNKKGELLYFADLNNDKRKIRNKIHNLTKINKSIFDGKNTVYGKILKKIKEKYLKENTSKLDRSVRSGKNFSAANYSIHYNNNIEVLTYNRFEYEDFYNQIKQKSKKDLYKSIDDKIKDIKCLTLFESIDKDFSENIKLTILKILETEELLKERILLLIQNIKDIDLLLKIENLIISETN